MTTNIEWTDDTWNPVTGCTKVSQGCKNCYAERVWNRLSAPNMPYEGREFTDVRCHPSRLLQPLHWKRPRRIFVNSMSDLFHVDVPFDFIDQVFAVMALASHHVFQVLTKRPDRMLDYLQTPALDERIGWIEGSIYEHIGKLPAGAYQGPTHRELPLDNVWLGVSVEDQDTADERIIQLMETPAAVRFISLEPMLGSVDLTKIPASGAYISALNGARPAWHPLDWVIVGGESGPKARPMHPNWVRSIRSQCQAAGVPFFFKQWGEWRAYDDCVNSADHMLGVEAIFELNGRRMARVGKKAAGRDLEGRTWDDFPK